MIYWCKRWVAESRYGHKWPAVFYTRTFNVMTSQSRVGLTVSRSLTSLGRFDVIVIVNMVATRKPFAWLTKCCRVVVKENVCDASDQHFWRPPLWPLLRFRTAHAPPFRFGFFFRPFVSRYLRSSWAPEANKNDLTFSRRRLVELQE